jgi:hypothetical protein
LAGGAAIKKQRRGGWRKGEEMTGGPGVAVRERKKMEMGGGRLRAERRRGPRASEADRRGEVGPRRPKQKRGKGFGGFIFFKAFLFNLFKL